MAGVPPRAVEAFAMVVEAAGVLAQPEAIRRVVLGDWTALERHLDVDRRCSEPAGLSVLLLNNRNQLLAEPSWQADEEGGGLIQEMLRHALDQHATAAILVRNRAGEPPRITARTGRSCKRAACGGRAVGADPRFRRARAGRFGQPAPARALNAVALAAD